MNNLLQYDLHLRFVWAKLWAINEPVLVLEKPDAQSSLSVQKESLTVKKRVWSFVLFVVFEHSPTFISIVRFPNKPGGLLMAL